MSNENVQLNDGFSQVCVWPGCVIGEAEVDKFVAFMRDELGVRVQYLEEVATGPDTSGDGAPVEGTGGRNDVFFAVHDDDISGPFCIKRLTMGMRWIEDVLSPGNYSSKIYPSRVAGYCSWSTGEEEREAS